MNTKTDLNIGDLLYRSKSLVQHVGVYLGNNIVIHNSPDGDIQEVSFEVFAKNKEVKIEKIELDNISVLTKNLKLMRYDTSKYSVINNNCEQFARKLLGMRPTSPQVKAVTIGVVTGALSSIVTKKNPWMSMFLGATTALIIENSNKKYDGVISPNN